MKVIRSQSVTHGVGSFRYREDPLVIAAGLRGRISNGRRLGTIMIALSVYSTGNRRYIASG